MAETNRFAIILTAFLFQFGSVCISPVRSLTTLHLIALVPTENENATRCVDRGEELLIAARIAEEVVDASNDILQGYKLEVIEARSDSCTAESFSLALTGFVRQITNNSYNPVGVIGMVCPSTMLHISPFASLPGISLLQITAGTTPPTAVTISRDRVTIEHVYQTAPSSTIHNDALIALMREQGWQNIALVRLSSSLNIIHVNQGRDLQDKIEENPKSNIVFSGEISSEEAEEDSVQILDEIVARKARIIYATLPDKEARELLCASYFRNIASPLYSWILHDHSPENLKKGTDNCTIEQMTKVLNGVILLRYNLTRDRNMFLSYSQLNYGEYEDMYKERLQRERGSETLCEKEPDLIYSNAMYDSVIAFARALNDSQATVDLSQYHNNGTALGMTDATTKINENLLNIEFAGAGGMISFNASTHKLDFRVGVGIHRIVESELLPFAYYDGTTDKVTRLQNYAEISDSFEEDIRKIPVALSVVILVIVAILVALSIMVLILFVYHWSAPDIKATSPTLSIVIFLACFLLYLSAVFTAVRSGFSSGTAFAALCTLEWWTFVIGIQLIFATLFMRLLRVYRIFFHYQKVGKVWSDVGLLVFIALIVSVSVTLLVLWTAVDTLTTVEGRVFRLTGNRPHFDVYLDCRSNHLGVWLGLILGYTGLIMIVVLALAVMTRKVKIESFRDTKEVNAFVFTTVFVIVVCIPLSLILQGESEAALFSTFIFRVLCLTLVPIACKVFVFAPKIYYARFGDPTRQKSSFETSGKYTGRKSSFEMSGKHINHKSSFSASGIV